ncbi:MAG: hypothetical protein FWH41_05460 [Treponema sp.]|nr:hypothetical protein [Treponema sp.]
MRIPFFFIILKMTLIVHVFAQTEAGTGLRSFNEIFPNLQPSVRQEIFSDKGYSKSYKGVSSSASLIGAPRNSRLDQRILEPVIKIKPGFYVESIAVIPAPSGKYSLLHVYNVLRKVRTLKGRLYHSFTRNESVPLFEDVTRVESAHKNTPLPDPSPALRIPSSETIYLLLKDANFGNTYYRGELILDKLGMRYSLTNYKSFTYFLIPVIKEEKFIAQLYFEPITDGILIYGLSGADVSDFIASKVDMPSAVSKRLAVITSWVSDGIKGRL